MQQRAARKNPAGDSFYEKKHCSKSIRITPGIPRKAAPAIESGAAGRRTPVKPDKRLTANSAARPPQTESAARKNGREEPPQRRTAAQNAKAAPRIHTNSKSPHPLVSCLRGRGPKYA